MSDTSASEKTEQATPKRMKEVREKGQLASSKDFTGWISVAAAAVTIPAVIGAGADSTTTMVSSFRTLVAHPEPEVALEFMINALMQVLPIIGPMLAVVFVATIVASMLQGGIHLKKFKPSFEHFNLLKGVQRIFGKQALWEGAKALLKTAVVGLVLCIAIQGLVPFLMNAGGLPVTSLLGTASSAVTGLMQSAIAAGIGLAILDVFVVIRRNRKKTMMTKQEVRDENKSSEGDPHVKGQRRSRQLAMSRNRMIAAVASADVVLLNPTHIAVALKYEPGKSAPRVVAKGSGAIAAKIRERAADTRVPMVENIPLARALHAACDVGQEIPEELYSQVAQVLAFVMSLKRRGAAMGVHRLSTKAAA